MTRVLVTGASGMLGAALVTRWDEVFEVYATGGGDFEGNRARRYLPFDLRAGTYDSLVSWARPEVIVHCAALTNVDACEATPAEAFRVNGESVARLLAAATGVRIIFISTDAVMPSDAHLAPETTPPVPRNIYASSKRLGEQILLDAAGDHCVVRTTIVGRNMNPNHSSFCDWIVQSVRAGRTIQLFDDVVFTPISVWHLADELRWLIDHRAPRLLHVSGSEVVSKYDFGVLLCQAMEMKGQLVHRGRLADQVFSAPRSKDQTLSSQLYTSISHRALPNVGETIRELTAAFSAESPTWNTRS